jgi:hypothetical protein
LDLEHRCKRAAAPPHSHQEALPHHSAVFRRRSSTSKRKPAEKERRCMTDYALTHFNQLSGNDPTQAAITQVPDQPKFDDVSSRLEELRAFETADILEMMEGIKTAIDMSKHAEAFKGKTRETYIACNLALNERMGKSRCPAPAFRPQPKRTNFPIGSEAALSNIARIIDMHFCAMMGHTSVTHELSKEIFGEPFDFDKALEFSSTPGKVPAKLKILDLDDEETIALCRLGNMSLKTVDDRSAQKAFFDRRKSYLVRLKNRSIRGNPNHEAQADLLAVGSMLKALDYEVTGKNLMLGCRLIGRYFGSRPSGYKNRYQKLMKTLRSKKPA